MKYSESDTAERAERGAYISERWGQLSKSLQDTGDAAVKWISLVNAGAIAAGLSFIGAMDHIRSAMWPRAALIFFCTGLVLIGFYHAYAVHSVTAIFKVWRRNATAWREDKLDWNDLIGDDRRLYESRIAILGYVIPWASFICFLIGLSIALYNFGDITRQEPTTMSDKSSPPTPQPSTPPAPKPPTSVPGKSIPDTGPRPDRTVIPSRPAPPPDPVQKK